MFKALTRDFSDCSSFGHIVKDSKSIIGSLQTCSFSHVRRQGNIATHVFGGLRSLPLSMCGMNLFYPTFLFFFFIDGTVLLLIKFVMFFFSKRKKLIFLVSVVWNKTLSFLFMCITSSFFLLFRFLEKKKLLRIFFFFFYYNSKVQVIPIPDLLSLGMGKNPHHSPDPPYKASKTYPIRIDIAIS